MHSAIRTAIVAALFVARSLPSMLACLTVSLACSASLAADGPALIPQPVKMKIGYTLDIAGERVQTDDRKPARRVNEQDWRIRLRNHKDVPVQVEVLETLQRRRANWEILEKSHEYKKKDYRTIVFEVDVPANGEVVVTYTVRYWW